MMFASVQDSIEDFRADLAALRARAEGHQRTAFEEDLQGFSNRRFHLSSSPSDERRILEAIVSEHQRIAPHLRLRVLNRI
jgi:hypothetical protein